MTINQWVIVLKTLQGALDEQLEAIAAAAAADEVEK